mmetsp:Transcript_12762/g.43211  ORF Transcript_12762/g.43211 Transcript_12762/m.43211 type:complete len:481 (-) Transcript_12762:716-2158(-)
MTPISTTMSAGSARRWRRGRASRAPLHAMTSCVHVPPRPASGLVQRELLDELLVGPPFQGLYRGPLRQVHGLQEALGVLGLLGHARRVPALLLSHDLQDARERLEGGVGVEEAHPHAAPDHISGGLRELVAAREGHLGFKHGVLRVELLVEHLVVDRGAVVLVLARDEGQLEGARAVVGPEVLRGVLIEAVLLAEGHGDAVEVLVTEDAATVRADKLHRVRDTACRVLELRVERHCLVHRVLCHLAVGGPLAAGDGDEVPRDHVHHVVARELLGVARVRLWVAHERPDARPRGAHGAVVHGVTEHAVALGEDEVHLGEGRAGLEGDLARGVRSAGDGGALPGEEVEDAAVLGEPDHAHLVRRRIIRHDEVGARGRDHDLPAVRVGHLAHLVGEDAARVDHLLGLDRVLLASEHVANLGAAHLVVGGALGALGDEVEHLRVVLAHGAGLDGRQGDVEVHARVVLLAVVDDEAALELVAFRV